MLQLMQVLVLGSQLQATGLLQLRYQDHWPISNFWILPRLLYGQNAKSLSNNMSVITTRQDFTEKMINTLEDGAVNLTIADMNEEGANMLMLQTRQALGTTSLEPGLPSSTVSPETVLS